MFGYYKGSFGTEENVRRELINRVNGILNGLNKIKPWIGSALLIPLIYFLIKNDARLIIIDYVNLLIHEGGHGIFKFFGKYVHALGGTLAQILIPVMFVVYYFINKKKIPAQVSLVWLGQNLINISIYASDARAQKLPLLGGKKVYHDWTYLLGEIGLLNYDKEAGIFFYSLAIITFIIALLIPLLIKSYKPSKLNLDIE